jgi:hypothetical protein
MTQELCDEEKAFQKWLKEYSDYNSKINLIIKDAFYAGFVAGWSNKKIYTSEEMLQK